MTQVYTVNTQNDPSVCNGYVKNGPINTEPCVNMR